MKIIRAVQRPLLDVRAGQALGRPGRGQGARGVANGIMTKAERRDKAMRADCGHEFGEQQIMPTYSYMAENGLPFAQVFGERIRHRRKEMGLSQGVLFEKTGISAAYISSVERGSANPLLDIMVQLCVALECSIAEMLRPELVAEIP